LTPDFALLHPGYLLHFGRILQGSLSLALRMTALTVSHISIDDSPYFGYNLSRISLHFRMSTG